MPTIKDVARRAGVSIKTVSRVVNKDPAVRDSTREHVERVVAELGYTPDPAARSMRSNRTGVLGLVTDMIVTTPYSVDIISGVQDACAEAGMMMLIVNTRGDRTHTEHAIRTLVERKVEGIVYATMYLRAFDELPAAGDLPMVLVNCFMADGSVPSIVPDDYAGSYAATSHVIELGHRDIALLSVNPVIVAGERRGRGFRRALLDHGLNCTPDWVRAGQVFENGREVFVAVEATQRFLDGARRPTAIVCGTDAIAMRTYNAVRERGLRIPDDISIVGYDNFVMIAEALDPPLTSVALPYYDMGRTAVSWLRRLSHGDGLAEPTLLMPCPLIRRASCRAL